MTNPESSRYEYMGTRNEVIPPLTKPDVFRDTAARLDVIEGESRFRMLSCIGAAAVNLASMVAVRSSEMSEITKDSLTKALIARTNLTTIATSAQ